jgi:phosphatidylglycerol:prolipoprotein diacylglycerol transferase
MLAAAIPYFAVRTIGGAQAYGLFMFLALGAGVLVAFATARRYGVPWRDCGLLPIAIAAAFVGAHLWDVVAYQLDEDLVPWLRLWSGLSLFGGLAGVAITVWFLVVPWRRDLALYADIVVMACIVAIAVGRIGCALVHDHLGQPTDSMLGIDFPAGPVSYVLRDLPPSSGTIRLHDLGVEELLVDIPLAIAALVLLARRLRAGMMAAIVAIAYATARFLLDFLRLREAEPLHAGLTAGQWGCVMLLACALYGLVQVMRGGCVAPLAAELGDKPGGLAT